MTYNHSSRITPLFCLLSSTDYKILTEADLEKLAKQPEILVRVTKETPDNLNFIYLDLSSSNGEMITDIVLDVVPKFKKSLLPAVVNGNVQSVTRAILGGADVNSRNIGYGPALLHLAIKGGHQEIVKMRLK